MTCRLAGALGVWILLSGCSTWKVTDTQRTAVEQLLLSRSADVAASKITLPSLRGQTAFLDDSGLEATDKPYVVGALREQLGKEHILLVADAKTAEIIIEARSGALATDNFQFLIGLPALKVPIPSSTMTSIDTPELPFIRKVRQEAVAKFALQARRKATGELIAVSGSQFGTAYFNRWIVFFVPFEITDIPEKR